MNEKVQEAIILSRALQCNHIGYLPVVSEEEYLRILKEDWNSRAKVDPSVYVCAQSNATEEQICGSGIGDFEREFMSRIKKYNIPPCATVLEIGSGFGRMTMYLSYYAEKVYATDISGELLRIAKERLEKAGLTNVTYVETNGKDLSGIPDSSIDVAFEYIVFQHIPDRNAIVNYIKEINRVLNNKLGYFIMHGRDVENTFSGTASGNTWHGGRVGPELVKYAIEGTELSIIGEEGVGTDRYWAILRKG